MGNSLIKLAQRIRSTNHGSNNNQNRAQNNDSQNLLSSPILNLNGHCFDEIFEYLSLEDLNSLSQTCKSMQRMTGEFFTRNYSAAQFDCSIEIIQVPGFIHLITGITITNYVEFDMHYDLFSEPLQMMIILYYTHHLSKFKYIKLHASELKSLKKLTLKYVIINKQTVGYIRGILPKIEVLELISCTVCQDLYDVLLKYCKNVRRIQLSEINLKNNYKWLRRQYEKLEHLELDITLLKYPKKMNIMQKLCTFFEFSRDLNIRRSLERNHAEIVRFGLAPEIDFRIPELRTFFERPDLSIRRRLERKYAEMVHLGWVVENESDKKNRRIAELSTFFKLNPNLRSFSCDESTLMFNKDALLNSKVKLDTFELQSSYFEGKSLWNLLCQLHTHGFFKRLNVSAISNNEWDEMPPMPFIKHISLDSYERSLAPFATHLIAYAETMENSSWRKIKNSDKSKNETLVEDLMNVERLCLFREGSDIQLFIQQLKNLKELKLIECRGAEILELDELNKAREKLAGARKVTIYVPDYVFLETKWATKNGTTNFSLIELKRYKWYFD